MIKCCEFLHIWFGAEPCEKPQISMKPLAHISIEFQFVIVSFTQPIDLI